MQDNNFGLFNNVSSMNVDSNSIGLSNLQCTHKIVETQQALINKLTLELSRRSQTVSREQYERALNDLQVEKYDHAKTKLSLMEVSDKNKNMRQEIEILKAELEKERQAYENVFSLLKDKALTESTKNVDLIEKIAQNELKYGDIVHNYAEKDRVYNELFHKIKQKEKNYEHKISEINLKLEQDKYINSILNGQSKTTNTTSNNNNNNTKTRSTINKKFK